MIQRFCTCLSFFASMLLFVIPCRANNPVLSAMPSNAQSAVSASIGRDRAAYHVRKRGSTLYAKNSRGFSIEFGSTTVAIQSHRGSLRLAVESYGYPGSLIYTHPVEPIALKNRVEYRRGLLNEWYENGPAGLEQGFTLARRPPGNNGEQLRAAIALSNRWRVVSVDAKNLTLQQCEGKSIVKYGGLSSRDSAGNELGASLKISGANLLLTIDDASAQYPLTIDPLIQAAEITAADGEAGDYFGTSVAVSQDTIVVGANNADGAGAAYVFTKGSNGWGDVRQIAKLTPSDAIWPFGDGFGVSVAIDRDTIVVGATGHVIDTKRTGAAYVYVKPPSGWSDATETAEFTITDEEDGANLGYQVAASGNTVAVSAISENNSKGAIYIFTQPASGWVNTSRYRAKLTASDAPNGNLGRALSLVGDTVFASAPFGVNRPGAVYVFIRPPQGWKNSGENAVLTASDGKPGETFGTTLAASSTTVAVGNYANGDSGAVYIFAKSPAGWANGTQTAKLTTSKLNGRIGFSVALNDKVLVAGAAQANVGRNKLEGSAYVFLKPATGWVTSGRADAQITASDGQSNWLFGGSLAAGTGAFVIGAYGANDFQGSAYIFDLSNQNQ